MLRMLLTLVAGIGILAGGAERMEGQAQDTASSYDTRALRVETRWANRVLVRGREGTVVAKIGDGFRAPDLAATVASSPEALREAQEFRHRYNRGSVTFAAGMLVLGTAIGLARTDDLGNALVPTYFAIGVSSLLAAYGGVQLTKAYSALARSVWWYNRGLPR